MRHCSYLCFLPLVTAQTLTANDPRVLYTSRFVVPTDATTPALFGWSFAQVACSFQGVKITARLLGAPAEDIRMRVMVDGKFTKYINVPKNEEDTFVLAEGLSNTNHEVRLWKVTEDRTETAKKGIVSFYSFSLPSGGVFNDAPARLNRKLWFIGDSDTAYGQFLGTEDRKTTNCADKTGWVDSGGDNCMKIVSKEWCSDAANYAVNGVDANQACCGCKEGWKEVFDCTQNWAAQLSFALGAEMEVTAIAGSGISTADEKITNWIDYTVPYDKAYRWDSSKYPIPDAIVILIGPNDDPNSSDFLSDYMSMLINLATKYASASVKPKLIQVCGGSGNGLDPCAKIQTVVNDFNAASADHPGFEASFTTISKENWALINPKSHPSEYTGIDAHYNTKGAAILAKDIEPQVRSIMGWTEEAAEPEEDQGAEENGSTVTTSVVDVSYETQLQLHTGLALPAFAAAFLM